MTPAPRPFAPLSGHAPTSTRSRWGLALSPSSLHLSLSLSSLLLSLFLSPSLSLSIPYDASAEALCTLVGACPNVDEIQVRAPAFLSRLPPRKYLLLSLLWSLSSKPALMFLLPPIASSCLVVLCQVTREYYSLQPFGEGYRWNVTFVTDFDDVPPFFPLWNHSTAGRHYYPVGMMMMMMMIMTMTMGH
jgi:hypothetical protein